MWENRCFRECKQPPRATAEVPVVSWGAWGANLTLMRPNGRHRYRPYRREGLGHQVVDVIKHVGRQEPELDRPLLPARPQVQHLHGDPPCVDKTLQLDALDAAGIAEVGAHAEGAEAVISAQREQVLGTERQRPPARGVASDPPPRAEVR